MTALVVIGCALLVFGLVYAVAVAIVALTRVTRTSGHGRIAPS